MGIRVYECIFELCVFLCPVLPCVCCLGRSVSLGDTHYVCLPRSPTIPNWQGRRPGELRGAICEGTFCLSVGGGDELISLSADASTMLKNCSNELASLGPPAPKAPSLTGEGHGGASAGAQEQIPRNPAGPTCLLCLF